MDPATIGKRLSRRGFLTLSGRGVGLAAVLGATAGCGESKNDDNGEPPSDGDDPGTPPPADGLPATSEAFHVLKRSSFGVTPDALSEIDSLGVDAYLERQINYQSIDASAVDQELAQRFPLALQEPAALFDAFRNNGGELVRQVFGASLFQAFYSPRQLYELMVEFWSNHFSIHLVNGLGPVLKPQDDRTVIRPHALGRFRDMLQASARSPAMLFYLDNYLNTAAAPQENYARELLELHTLGVDGGFTETDVKEVARCFTGWTIRFATGQFAFIADLHDDGSKQVLGQTLPAGGGINDGVLVLDMLADAPATGRFLATKLARRFVADNPPAALVDALAATYASTDGDIAAMLRTLFADAAFRDTRDNKLARPMEFVGQLVRTLHGDGLPPDGGRLIAALLDLLGQLPFMWPPPDGYPDVAGYWGNTSGFLNRWRIALGLSRFPGFDPGGIAGNAGTLTELVDTVTEAVLFRALHSDDRALVIGWLSAETGVTADDALPPGVARELAPFVAAILVSSAYFQLR